MTDRAFPGSGDIARSWDVAAEDYAVQFFDELDRKPFDRQFLETFADAVAGRGRVADIGCGPGHIARYLAERGVDAFGVDLSPGMVAVARRLNSHLRFEVGDMTALDVPDAAWAGITAFYSLVNLPREAVPGALSEFARVLVVGGHLAVAAHAGEGVIRRDQWNEDPINLAFTMFSLDELVRAIEAAGFTIEEAIAREPYPAEHPTTRLYLRARRER